ncbi:hypothetical protein BSPP4475_16495 [Brevibacillus aydinogluensis]|uniref:Uncharacterized protein n=1 Tax=Brevibacillus aydinogluensis TaxID=927786 RepID=A0AA48RIX3_9BACL|nr:hypothetical protein BSPP4475_16495 [Brevibacillus aydinogluensis]
MKIRVFYDYHEGNLVPMKYMISFRKGSFSGIGKRYLFRLWPLFNALVSKTSCLIHWRLPSPRVI